MEDKKTITDDDLYVRRLQRQVDFDLEKNNDFFNSDVFQRLFNYYNGLNLIDEKQKGVRHDDRELVKPFIQHAINAECYKVGIESFEYTEEAFKEKLASAWRGVKKAFEINKKATSSVYHWMRSDGKGLIQNGLNQVKIIKDKRREARDVQIDAGLVIAIQQGAALHPLFQRLVDEGYSDYADYRNDASKVLRRVRPGQVVIKQIGSHFPLAEGNVALATLDENIKELREQLNTVKRRSRDATSGSKSLSTLIRDLDILSNFLEEIVHFIEVLEKDENNWEDDKERLQRLFDNENTDIKGAEGFIKLASDNSVGSLLRFMTTLIRFVSGTISRTHREMAKHQ